MVDGEPEKFVELRFDYLGVRRYSPHIESGQGVLEGLYERTRGGLEAGGMETIGRVYIKGQLVEWSLADRGILDEED